MPVGEVLQPLDAAAAAAMLKWAAGERLTVSVVGGGTKSTWGRAPATADVTLATTGMRGTLDHVPGDLTVTVPAGTTLEALNDALRAHRQWLALDPPFGDRATVGGIVATNDSGPRRHRFGTPRDLIIGIEVALVDGRTARAGGRVVKNVAGYDLSRLLCGSYGSLAIITSATFKLAPIPPASISILSRADDVRKLAALALDIGASALTPSAIEIASPPHVLLVRFETTRSAAEQQAKQATEICLRHGTSATILFDDEDTRHETITWRDHETAFWAGAQTVLKVSVLPTDVSDALELIQRLAVAAGVECRVCGRAAMGVLYARLAGDLDSQAGVASDLRQHAVKRRGTVSILAGSADLKRQVDPWGDMGDALPVMRAVKAQFDPRDTLNPGRGV